jgi:hypothetical protein
MAAPIALKPEDIKRWKFNALMDFPKKPVRLPAECLAYYTELLTEAWRLTEERRAEAEAVPAPPNMWPVHQDKEVTAMRNAKNAANNKVYAQEAHFYRLRHNYSYELAHALWWVREDRRRNLVQKVQDAYHAAWRAHRAEQEAFDNAQADKAIAELSAANPHLTAEKLVRLRALLKYALYFKGHKFARSEVPRRICRGLPLVACGCVPCEARLDYPPEAQAHYFTAF